MRNVLINYEIKKSNIIRKDYITKKLVNYTKDIKKNQYQWLDYETFKKIEKKLYLKKMII